MVGEKESPEFNEAFRRVVIVKRVVINGKSLYVIDQDSEHHFDQTMKGTVKAEVICNINPIGLVDEPSK